MDKKTYIQPEINVIKLKMNALMTGSNPGYDPNSGFSEENNVGARRGDFDFDDFDDEY